MNAAIQIFLFCLGWNFAAGQEGPVQGQITEWIACQGCFQRYVLFSGSLNILQKNLKFVFVFSTKKMVAIRQTSAKQFFFYTQQSRQMQSSITVF
jgi:hypothetical protein